jgi:hypothetical protein
VLAFHCLLLAFVWAIGLRKQKKLRGFLLACLPFAVVGCGCWRNVLIPLVCLLVWLGCGAFLLCALVARWLPACIVVGAILLHRVGSLSAFAWVGFSGVGCFRSRSFSRLSCSFLLVVLLPVWFRWFRSGSVSCSVAVRFLVVVFLLLFWQFLSAGLCPVVVACCGGVVLCFLPLSFFLPKGGGWGWLGGYSTIKSKSFQW